jgi:hypothetical protein
MKAYCSTEKVGRFWGDLARSSQRRQGLLPFVTWRVAVMVTMYQTGLAVQQENLDRQSTVRDQHSIKKAHRQHPKLPSETETKKISINDEQSSHRLD